MSGETVWVVQHEYDNGADTLVCSSEEKAYELAAWLIIDNLYELEVLAGLHSGEKDEEIEELIEQLCAQFVEREYRELYEAWDEFQDTLSERETYISVFEEMIDSLSQEHLEDARLLALKKLKKPVG